MSFSVVVYRCQNLGDMIQTLALTRLLPQAHGVYRHRLADAPPDRTLVLNGMLDKDAPPRPGVPPCVLAGVSGPHFRKQAYLRWMKASGQPVGARDRQTVDALTAAAIPATLTGCATLTLPRYDGPRRGVYSVDCPSGPGEALTHKISRDLDVPGQWARALELLERYRTAEAVHTSRLHVALPCLAFGTPVWITDPQRGGAWHPYRFSLLDELGVRYETLITADITPMARRYESFLAERLGCAIEPGEPKIPLLPPDPGPPRWRIPWP